MNKWNRQPWLQLGLGVLSLSGACDDSADKKASEDGGRPDATQRGAGTYKAGAFRIELAADGAFSVHHEASPDRVLVASPKGQSGIEAFQVDDSIEEQSGSFAIEEQIKTRCAKLEEVAIEGGEAGVTLTATVRCGGKSAPVSLAFSAGKKNALSFTLALEGDELPFNQVALVQAAEADERFVGFGEQFTFVDMRGHKFPIIVEEGGIGRAAMFEQLLGITAGSYYTTYAPMPFMLTDRGRALLLDNSELSWFDLTGETSVSTRVRGTEMRGHILYGDKPKDVVEVLTEFTGRMPKLPAWVNEGAIVGMQGGTERVREVLAQLEAQGTKVSAFWLQDWVGKRETPIGSRLWWNWQLNQAQYPGWDGLVADLKAKDIRVMTYINPYMVNVPNDPALPFTRNLYEEARKAGYLVKDAMGMPYVHVSGTFDAAVVDLTNPDAVDWYKDVIREEVLGVGASGYMADFGEALAFESVLASKESAASYHNTYAETWAKINREVLEEEGLMGEAVFFSRSGYTKCPGLSTLFWEGDQMVTWDADDGMQSAVIGLLSGGLSGISLNHSDIGGYTAIFTARTKEVLLRWMELSAFTAVYRTHEGSRPETSAQIYDDEESIAHFARFANVFAALSEYRNTLMDEAAKNGAPLVRHLLLEYPDDPRAWSEEHTFLLGPDVLVAPVVKPSATRVKAYVPAGDWIHLWTGTSYNQAQEVEVDAPIGQPAVFYRAGSAAGVALEAIK